MFGMGWSEVLLIGIVALIVVGPKDLPMMFRAMGQFTGKARLMAREFSKAMEAAADESGVKDISKTIRAASNPTAFGANALRDVAGLGTSKIKPGGATEALAKERAENKAKIDEAMATAARLREEKAAEKAAVTEPAPVAVPAAPVAPPPTPEPVAATPKTPKSKAAKPSTAKAAAQATDGVVAPAAKPKTPKPKAPKSDPMTAPKPDSAE